MFFIFNVVNKQLVMENVEAKVEIRVQTAGRNPVGVARRRRLGEVSKGMTKGEKK